MMAYYRLGTLTVLSSRRHLQVVHGVENNFMFIKEYNKSNTKNFLQLSRFRDRTSRCHPQTYRDFFFRKVKFRIFVDRKKSSFSFKAIKTISTLPEEVFLKKIFLKLHFFRCLLFVRLKRKESRSRVKCRRTICFLLKMTPRELASRGLGSSPLWLLPRIRRHSGIILT